MLIARGAHPSVCLSSCRFASYLASHRVALQRTESHCIIAPHRTASHRGLYRIADCMGSDRIARTIVASHRAHPHATSTISRRAIVVARKQTKCGVNFPRLQDKVPPACSPQKNGQTDRCVGGRATGWAGDCSGGRRPPYGPPPVHHSLSPDDLSTGDGIFLVAFEHMRAHTCANTHARTH